MPVDPQLQVVLDQVAARGGRITDQTPDEARRLAEEGMVALGKLAFEEVGWVQDRTIPGPAGEIPVRVYRPEGHGPHGVLAWFHGGGFVIGSLDFADQVCRVLCNRSRSVVVSVDYRLAPEHPFPAAVEDAWAATRWLQTNAAEVGGDQHRIAVGGDSAGGTLAAVVAITNRDTPRRPPLRFQALIYPGTDHVARYPSQDIGPGYLYDSEMRAWFYRQYLPEGVDRSDWRISPLRAASHHGLAPALVVTAEYDPLRDEGEAYAAALRETGVPVEHVRVDGMTHGFVQYNPIVDRAREVLDRIGSAVGRALA